MMKKIYIILAVLISCALNSCQKESHIAPRKNPFPAISEIVTENNSVKLNAEFFYRGDAKIISYGFEWHSYKASTDNEQCSVEFTGDPGEKFSFQIDGGLKAKILYVALPFVRTEENIIYGRSEFFDGIKCNAPVINNFYPQSASFGDTIVIEGSNFSVSPTGNKVSFNYLEADVINVELNKIYISVPNLPEAKDYNLRVETAGQYSSSNNLVKFNTPWEVLSPINFSVSNSVSFVMQKQGYFVYPPSNILMRLNPDTETFSTIGDLPLENAVDPLAASNDNLAVVLLTNQLYSYSPDAGWKFVAVYPYTRTAGDYLFYLNGEIYIGSTLLGKMYHFNASTSSWETRAPLSNYEAIYLSSYSYANKGYLVTYANGGTSDLCIYNPATDSWQMETYPFTTRGWSCHFFVDGLLYTGLGAANKDDAVTGISTMQTYNLTTGEWNFFPDAPRRWQCEMSMTIDGIGYMFPRNSFQMWKFDRLK